MGCRLVLRKFTYPAVVRPREKLSFTSWWENKGVAPCCRKFTLALRLSNGQQTAMLATVFIGACKCYRGELVSERGRKAGVEGAVARLVGSREIADRAGLTPREP
jgi:hypothetical protein